MTLSTVLTWRSIDDHPEVRRARTALADADEALQSATEAAQIAEQTRCAIEQEAAHGRSDERKLTAALDAELLAQSRLRTARHRCTAAASALDEARQQARRSLGEQLASAHDVVATEFEKQLAVACASSRHAAALEDASSRLCGKGLPPVAWRREFGESGSSRFDDWRRSRVGRS